MAKTHEVVVVGANFGGIVAARDLTDRGHPVVVLEGGSRIGGPTYARPFTGQERLTVELGGSPLVRIPLNIAASTADASVDQIKRQNFIGSEASNAVRAAALVQAFGSRFLADRWQCAESGREATRVASGDVVANGNLVNLPV
jgi:monoamine oxidase